jgi:hypothetical protein
LLAVFDNTACRRIVTFKAVVAVVAIGVFIARSLMMFVLLRVDARRAAMPITTGVTLAVPRSSATH